MPDADRGARRSFGDQLLALLLRPTAPPLWLGLVVAAGFITGETLLVHRLQQISAGTNAYGAVFLLGVLVVSAGWDFLLAVGMSLTSALVYVYFHLGTGAALLLSLAVLSDGSRRRLPDTTPRLAKLARCGAPTAQSRVAPCAEGPR